ncbi:MAG: hypothetical protein ACRDTJ_07000, partial [Pseudonocardiaceae bacterium]
VQAGIAFEWARHMPGLLQRRGLADIGADCEVPLFEGGSVGAEFLRVSMSQLSQQGVIASVTANQMDEWNALMSQPGRWFPGLAIISAWGRRPSTASR